MSHTSSTSDVLRNAGTTVASDASWALEKQFDRIIAEHSRAIWRLACSYEPVAGRREELMQDIALALWQALPHFRGECSERTFVFRIAHNRGLSHIWKRKPAHESIDKLPERDHPIDERPEPEEQAAQECRRVALMSAVRSLPVTYRQMILLMLEDLSHAEMAEIVGITERNVAVRLNRARKALKEALEGQS